MGVCAAAATWVGESPWDLEPEECVCFQLPEHIGHLLPAAPLVLQKLHASSALVCSFAIGGTMLFRGLP